MRVPKPFTSFDVDASTVSLWLFKKKPQPAASPPKYTGRWVDTNDELDVALKEAISNERARITEVDHYGLLAQKNEGSALTIDLLETHASLITNQMGAELPASKVKEMQQIKNTDFYVVKLAKGKSALYAVKKTEGSWQAKKMNDAIYTFFSNYKLGLDDKPSFRISRSVDFFVIDDQVLISNKGHFESVLNYKQAHIEDFHALQKEPVFTTLFSTLDPLVQFVGSNKIHLRRVSAIHSKGHYKSKTFMARLRTDHTQYQLKLNFDAQGRIVPTDDTCADIIRALLDHRLLSPFSQNLYDVPDATVVP